MKSFFGVLFIGLTVLLFVGFSANAAQLRLGSDGSVTAIGDLVTYSLPGITVSKEAAQYTKALKSAYESPGKRISVVTKARMERKDFLHVEQVITAVKAMVYNVKIKTVTIVDDSAVVSKTTKSDWVPILGVVYIILVITVLTFFENITAFTAIGIVIVLITAIVIAAAAVLVTIPTIAGLAISIVFIVTTSFSFSRDKTHVKYALILGIILMSLGLVFNYFLL